MNLNTLFGKRLKESRHIKGVTQQKLAELTGIHDKVIARYERGGTLPNLENLTKIAEALEVSIDFFAFEHSEPKGIPVVHDPQLYGRYFVLETLNEKDRDSVLNLLDSLIARQKLKEILG